MGIWDFIKGVGKGIVEGLGNTAKGLIKTIDQSPAAQIERAATVATVVSDPKQAVNNVKQNITNTIQEAKNDKTGEKAGELTGKAIVTVGLAVLTTKGLNALSKTVAVTEAAGTAAAETASTVSIRTDIVLSGGRSGQLVKTLTGPANSVIKGGQGRIFITDDAGKVIWDITKDRAKSVIPGQGFGPKVAPTQEQISLLQQAWGD